MAFLEQRPRITMDIEIYRNYFLVMFMEIETGRFRYFEKYDIDGESSELDMRAITRMLKKYTIVHFNGIGFDEPILSMALAGASCRQMKAGCDAIILQKLRHWRFYEEFGVQRPRYIDSIDLIDVASGVASLKLYGARLGCDKLQELPIDPNANIRLDQIEDMRTYCQNDNVVTKRLYEELEDQLATRELMSEQYRVDLRSKSDAQIAEAVITSEIARRTGVQVKKPYVDAGQTFRYKMPPFMRFKTPTLKSLQRHIEKLDFKLSPKMSVELPQSLKDTVIILGDTRYQMGIGGLHSTEKSRAVIAKKGWKLVDRDVASYYPEIIRQLSLYPKHLGRIFLDIYCKFIDTRLEAKGKVKQFEKGTKEHRHWKNLTETLKIVINGTFGKLGSIYSKLCSHDLMIQVTITGQLSLLMLIERLEEIGAKVVSANTDGIVIYHPDTLDDDVAEIIAQWESETGFTTEETQYSAVYSRDVNAYMAIGVDGDVKCKGAFAENPTKNNPVSLVCTDALSAFLTEGTPLAATIMACDDPHRFVTVRTVNGGGRLSHGYIEPSTTKKAMVAALMENGYTVDDALNPNKSLWGENEGDDTDYCQTLEEAYHDLLNSIEHTYLGKVVRFYYAKGSKDAITYVKSGNKVPSSDGCRPLMNMNGKVPNDIDYGYYVNECKSLLELVGYRDAS